MQTCLWLENTPKAYMLLKYCFLLFCLNANLGEPHKVSGKFIV